MIKSFVVDSAYNNMRLDRYLRNKLGQIPQSLIEKNIRNGKIKLNRKKTKSSILNFLLLSFFQSKKRVNWYASQSIGSTGNSSESHTGGCELLTCAINFVYAFT